MILIPPASDGARLIDREHEVAELRALAASRQKQLGIVYGRRQVGKTFLLSHAWQGTDTRVFYFLCAALTPELNRQDLLRELGEWSGHDVLPADFPTWRTVFRQLASLAADRPLVVVLDEFQYLLGDQPDAVTSQLVAVWDRLSPTTPLLLVLSGSEVSTMAHLHQGGEPLYGRVTWVARLLPFDYRDAARMRPDSSLREAVAVYGILGGTPRYLAALRPGEPLVDGVLRVFLSPRGEVHLQMLSLLEQEKGLRDPAEYRAVLTAVATGGRLIQEIAVRTGLPDHAVRRALGVLADLDLVRVERNFGASPRAALRFLIADNAVAFWHRFVVPERSRFTAEPSHQFWDEVIAPTLDTYLGGVFEQVVRQAFVRYHERWGLPAAREWSRWEGVDRQRQSVEIDVVARLQDGRLLAGEVKWSSAPFGPGLHTVLLGKLERLSVSGQGWARDAASCVLLYVSAAGFSPEMHALAHTDPRVLLLSLPDLYL